MKECADFIPDAYSESISEQIDVSLYGIAVTTDCDVSRRRRSLHIRSLGHSSSAAAAAISPNSIHVVSTVTLDLSILSNNDNHSLWTFVKNATMENATLGGRVVATAANVSTSAVSGFYLNSRIQALTAPSPPPPSPPPPTPPPSPPVPSFAPLQPPQLVVEDKQSVTSAPEEYAMEGWVVSIIILLVLCAIVGVVWCYGFGWERWRERRKFQTKPNPVRTAPIVQMESVTDLFGPPPAEGYMTPASSPTIGPSTANLYNRYAQSQSAQSLSHATRAFDRADRNGTGGVDAGELSRFMQGAGTAASPGQTAQLFKAMDKDGDGVVSRTEWLEHHEQTARLSQLGQITRAFDRADRNGSGGVDAFELSHFMQGIPNPSDLAQLFKAMDKDSDGVVSRAEWLAYYKQATMQNETPPPATLEWLRRGQQWVEDANEVASPVCTSAGVAVAPSDPLLGAERETARLLAEREAAMQAALTPDARPPSPSSHSPKKLAWSPLPGERSRSPGERYPYEEQAAASPRSVSLQLVSDGSGNHATASVIGTTPMQFVPAASSAAAARAASPAYRL